jgi:hypothetical protein
MRGPSPWHPRTRYLSFRAMNSMMGPLIYHFQPFVFRCFFSAFAFCQILVYSIRVSVMLYDSVHSGSSYQNWNESVYKAVETFMDFRSRTKIMCVLWYNVRSRQNWKRSVGRSFPPKGSTRSVWRVLYPKREGTKNKKI